MYDQTNSTRLALSRIEEQNRRIEEMLGLVLERLARQDASMTTGIEDEINSVLLRGGDLYEHFKAKERALPRRKRRKA